METAELASSRSAGETRGHAKTRDLTFLGDEQLEAGDDLGVELDLELVPAEVLDRLVELDLALVDLDALRLQELGDVARGDRTVEHVVLAHLAGRDEAQRGDPRGELLELGLLLREPREVRLLLLLDHRLVG